MITGFHLMTYDVIYETAYPSNNPLYMGESKIFNEGLYNFLKSNSLVCNFTYKLYFTILDYEQNFEGGFRWKCMVEITCWAW